MWFSQSTADRPIEQHWPGSLPELNDGVRHGLKYQDFKEFGHQGGGDTITSKWAVAGTRGPLDVEFSYLASFILQIH